jgi:tRNA-2-methylthio-N6-dimethylallyladenosine synthase
MRIYLETMGCQMNRLDSELAVSSLLAAGHQMVDDPRTADVLLYNTCSVRQHAEDKVRSRLGADGRRKSASRRRLIVGVLGCMAQRKGDDLRREFPHVDIVVGPGQLESLPRLIEAAERGQAVVAIDPPRGQQGEEQGGEFDSLDLARDVRCTNSSAAAFVRITRGCDKFCSYCVVPYVRLCQRNRRPQRIAGEVRRLVEAGRGEITLLGQTVNSYRWSDGGATTRFSDLLAMLSPIAGLRRLRFITSHPLDFGDDVLAAIRDLPNVCPYIHLPAQSGSDAVLRGMNRKYSRAYYDELVDRIRETVPEAVLSGDFIVGFPGESEQDHQASADLIRRCGYKNSFIFKYSPRPGTYAEKYLKDDVPDPVKRRRNNELLAVQAEVGLAHHTRCIGRKMEILVEGPSRRVGKQANPPRPDAMQLVGRTRGDHIVVFDGPSNLAGRYVDVEITGATALTLFGKQQCEVRSA